MARREDKKDITEVVEEHLCHSCGACYAACPVDCITYKETVGGYLFPKIDYNTCTNCELCFRVCGGDHFGKTIINNLPENNFTGNILECKIGVATDKSIYDNSQSGGITTQLLKYLLDTKKIEVAIVATTNNNESTPRGEAIIVDSSNQLLDTQKSKYTPIPLLSLIPKLKKIKGPIAIVGLSCHFHSLQNLADTFPWIRKKDIIKIGLICDRVMTAKAIDFLSGQVTTEKVENFVFRDKNKPVYPGNPVINTKNNEYVLDKSVRTDMKDFFTPARCRLCFDKLNILADLVMGDPHGISNIDKEINGETLVIVRTERGKELLDELEINNNIVTKIANTEESINGQQMSRNTIEWNSYMNSWEKMGKKAPEYTIQVEKKNSRKAEKDLKHALNLDNFSSKEELLKKAQKQYKFILFKRKIKKIILKIKGNK